jgi:hypothetical protein
MLIPTQQLTRLHKCSEEVNVDRRHSKALPSATALTNEGNITNLGEKRKMLLEWTTSLISWLKQYESGRKDAVSIPYEAAGFFNRRNPSSRTMAAFWTWDRLNL